MIETISQDTAAIDALMSAQPVSFTGPLAADSAGKAQLVEAMSQLAVLLTQGRLDAGRSFEQLKSMLHHQRANPEFKNLADAMGRLDYVSARKALIALAATMNIVLANVP